MPFDPSKPFEIEGAPKATGFDPTKPFDIVTEEPKVETPKTKVDLGEALKLGGFQGLSLGFADELSGRLEQLGSVFGRRGWGTEPIFQGRPETPDEQKESLAEVYAKGRDIRREREAAAKKEYPIAYPVAEFVGGMAAPIGAGTAAKSFLGAAAKGAASGAVAGGLQAAGTTEAETSGEIAKESLGGAGLGLMFGAGAGLVGRGLTGVTKAGRESLGAELEAFKRGYESPSLVDGMVTRTAKGLKETLAQGKQIGELKNFLAQNKKAYLSQMIEDGNLMEDQLKSARGMLDLMSDDEYIQMMVRSNTAAGKQIQDLIAKQAGSGFGGREKIEEYAKILGMGIDERSAARNFMASKEAAGIVQPAQQALSQLTKKTGEKYRELEQKAASEFQGISPEVEDFVLDVQDKVQDIVENPEFFNADFKNSLEKAFGILKSGKGPKFLKINRGEYTDVDDIERFNRLQKFKEVVRESIRPDVLSKKVGVKADVSERMASDLIGQVDDILRNSDDKIKANAIYSRMRDIEDFVFKSITRKGQVQREKVAGQLSKRQSAEQWREDLNDLRRWAKDDIFSEEDREAVKKFLQVYDEAFQKAEDANLVKKFSWDAGPSSPGIQRFLSAVRNNTEIQDLLQNPAKAVAEIDNFSNSYLKQLTGKDKFGDLSELEQRAFVRAQNWFRKEVKSGIVSPQSLVDNYKMFLTKLQKESAKGGGSGKFFSGQNVKEDIKDALTNYIGTKIGTAGLNELAKAAGSEQGINVFEPLKEDFKKYLIDEYKLTDTQAGIVIKVLPDNPLELMGMLPRRTMARMGDVIKFKNKAERKAQFYKNRERGPFDDEISDWINDIKKMPKKEQEISARELIRANQPGEIEEYLYIKKQLDKLGIKPAPNDKTDKKQIDDLKKQLSKYKQDDDLEAEYSFDFDDIENQLGYIPRDGEIVTFDGSEMKAERVGDKVYLTNPEGQTNKQSRDKLEKDILYLEQRARDKDAEYLLDLKKQALEAAKSMQKASSATIKKTGTDNKIVNLKNVKTDEDIKKVYGSLDRFLKGPKKETYYDDYKISHTAPTKEGGAPLHNLKNIYPDDFYSKDGARFYGDGRNEDKEIWNIISSLKDRPDATVTVYRAVPNQISQSEQIAKIEKALSGYLKRNKMPNEFKNETYDSLSSKLEKLKSEPKTEESKIKINPGDWVTLSKQYAIEHGMSALNNNYKILSKKVKASDLFTDGNSLYEQGYDPKK